VTIVVDSSLVFAALINQGGHGRWAESVLASEDLAAPHHMLVEVVSTLRRAVLAGDISENLALVAHAELLAITLELHPFTSLGERVWQLRHTVTAYDGWYVALAEALDAPLATLDLRLARAPGPRCRFVMP
jgi:predicted nucleic acid-binding protein